MSLYQRAPEEVSALALDLIERFHPDLVAVRATIDYLFAFAPTDEAGNETGPALSLHGTPCLGIAKITNLKDRAKGMGDGEISIDADWWKGADDDERAAMLDHELHHFTPKKDKYGAFVWDDLRRPALKMRKHDVEVGWFHVIAARHGRASQEVKQAASVLDNAGQLYWPDLCEGTGIGGTGKVSESMRTRGAEEDDLPRLETAIASFRDAMKKAAGPGGSVTITGGGQSVKISG